MRLEPIAEAIKAAPFRPFTVNLADGSGVYVSHPEWVILHHPSRTLVAANERGGVKIVDVGLVVSIDIAPSTEAAAASIAGQGGE